MRFATLAALIGFATVQSTTITIDDKQVADAARAWQRGAMEVAGAAAAAGQKTWKSTYALMGCSAEAFKKGEKCMADR